MRVAEAIVAPRFLKGTHAIEYVRSTSEVQVQLLAYHTIQVTVALDRHDHRMLIERHRRIGATMSDPLPRWRAIRGSGIDDQGFYGLWLPHLPDLLTECRLVRLVPGDRPTKETK